MWSAAICAVWIIAVARVGSVRGRVTVGYIPAHTKGDVHILSSFKTTSSTNDVSVTTEVMTSNSKWEAVILDGESLVNSVSLLADCRCDCLRSHEIAKKTVLPMKESGSWTWHFNVENPNGLIVVALATCDSVRVHSGDDIVEYAVTIVNGDGTHTSSDEAGIMGGHTFLLIIWEIAVVAFFYTWMKHYKVYGPFSKKSRGILYIFSISIGLYSVFLWCEMSHLRAYTTDGFGNPLMHFLSMMFRTASHSCFVALLLVLPSTYITQSALSSDFVDTKMPALSWDVSANSKRGGGVRGANDVGERVERLAAMARRIVTGTHHDVDSKTLTIFLAAYALFSFWSSYEIDMQHYTQSEAAATGWKKMSIVATLFSEVFIFFAFVQRVRIVQRRVGPNRDIYMFFMKYLYGYTPFFVTSMIRLLVSTYCAPWSRFVRSIDVLWTLTTFASCAAMGWILWPTPSNWILFTDDQLATAEIVRDEHDDDGATSGGVDPFASILSVSVKKKKTKASRVYARSGEEDYDEIPSTDWASEGGASGLLERYGDLNPESF
eukprot:g136.t1